MDLSNRKKTTLIDALRTKYPLNDLLVMAGLPKSSYFYQKEVQKQPDKYASLRVEVKKIFHENQSRYGYRRVHALIKNKGITVSEKVIRRIMKEELLFEVEPPADFDFLLSQIKQEIYVNNL